MKSIKQANCPLEHLYVRAYSFQKDQNFIKKPLGELREFEKMTFSGNMTLSKFKTLVQNFEFKFKPRDQLLKIIFLQILDWNSFELSLIQRSPV